MSSNNNKSNKGVIFIFVFIFLLVLYLIGSCGGSGSKKSSSSSSSSSSVKCYVCGKSTSGSYRYAGWTVCYSCYKDLKYAVVVDTKKYLFN